MAKPIKFGTDGWRAIIADDYTLDNVLRVAEATALYLQKNNAGTGKQVVIGYDCRFGGKLFSEATAKVMGAYGIKSLLAPSFISTPMVSLGVIKTKSDLGVVITASHNPPSYNGFKLKSHFGGPSLPSQIEGVESLIPDVCSLKSLPTLEELEAKGLLEYMDFEGIYIHQVREKFNLTAINFCGSSNACKVKCFLI